MSIPPATSRAARTISPADRSVWAIRARAAARAYPPPEPAQRMPSEGWITSPGAAQEQAVPFVGGDEHRLQATEEAIGPPELGQLGGGPEEVLGMVAELGLEPLQQREAVGGAAGEADQDLPVEELADLDGVGLHDRRSRASPGRPPRRRPGRFDGPRGSWSRANPSPWPPPSIDESPLRGEPRADQANRPGPTGRQAASG